MGRPTLIIPYPDQLERLSVGSRWNEKFVRETPTGSVKQYRDDLDGLLQSQVIWMTYQDVPATIDFICLSGSEIWRSRVPLISWTRVEWHLPDRVLRQFDLLPRIDMPPMESNFQRTDGRGKVGVDFAVYHHRYISLWENRRSYVVHGGETEIDGWPAVTKYMNWYRSWASLQLLSAPTEAPTSYYPRAPTEIAFREYFLNIEETLQPFFGFRGIHPSELERAIDRCEELSSSMRRRMYIEDTRYQDMPEYTQAGNIPEGAQANAPGTDEADPSSYPDSGPHWEETHVDVSALVPYRSHPSFDLQFGVADQSSHERPPGPSPFYVYGGMPTESPDVMPTAAYYVSSPMMESTPNPDPQQQLEPLPPHQLRDRPLRRPQHYTPGSDAIPRRGRGRRR